MKPPRPCGCSPYLGFHADACPDTPIYAQLVKDGGVNPADLWPFIVASLTAPHGGKSW